MLDPTALLAYAVALGVAAAIPDPGRTALVALAQRRLHRGAAVAMAGAAGTMIAREI